MEEIKTLQNLLEMDERHELMAQITGHILDQDKLHRAVSSIKLNEEVPADIRCQFNVARNMAFYTYFLYSLAPVVQLKTYILIEHALKIKNGKGKPPFKHLIRLAVENEWIQDSGFRHIEEPNVENEYCKSLIETLPNLRNEAAHGSNTLVGNCVFHLSSCADFINQLWHKTNVE